MEDEIVFYTLNCPRCKVLEIKLKNSGLSFSTIENADEVTETGKKHNIASAPFLRINDTFLDFSQAIKYINERR